MGSGPAASGVQAWLCSALGPRGPSPASHRARQPALSSLLVSQQPSGCAVGLCDPPATPRRRQVESVMPISQMLTLSLGETKPPTQAWPVETRGPAPGSVTRGLRRAPGSSPPPGLLEPGGRRRQAPRRPRSGSGEEPAADLWLPLQPAVPASLFAQRGSLPFP